MTSSQHEGGVNVGSTKPYLIRALFEWCVDQGFTPYLSVAVDAYTQVPKAYVKEGHIVLNLSPEAVQQLSLGNEFVTLSARFGGVAQSVSVPIGRVAAIYARENGNGMAFDVEETVAAVEPPAAVPTDSSGGGDKPARPKSGGKSHLTRVK